MLHCPDSHFSRHLPLGEPKPIALMCEPCSVKPSSKLLFDHSAALSGTRRDTTVLLHVAARKAQGARRKAETNGVPSGNLVQEEL
jgi:hypothetical protein